MVDVATPIQLTFALDPRGPNPIVSLVKRPFIDDGEFAAQIVRCHETQGVIQLLIKDASNVDQPYAALVKLFT